MIIAVGSGNNAKVEAVRSACTLLFGVKVKIVSCAVESGVRRQPFGDEECIRGAYLRSSRAFVRYPDADYGIGVENGICCSGTEQSYQEYYDRGWVVVQQKGGKRSQASTVSLFIPQPVAQYLRSHPDDGLGRLLNCMYDRTDVAIEEGYTGLVTDNVLDRTMVLTQAVICAFAPFVQSSFFEKLRKAVAESAKR